MQERIRFNPERNLLVAVLRRALFDYVQGSSAEKMAARDWLFDGESQNIFSYLWVCLQLEIEPESILGRLKRGAKSPLIRLAA